VAVLFHDDDLLRVGAAPLVPGKSLVADYTYDELRGLKLACGGHISSLDATLREFPDTRFNIDVKSASGVATVAAVVNAQKAHDRVLISSFSDKRRKATLTLLDAPVATGAGSSIMLRAWLSVAARRFLGARLSQVLLRAALNGVDAVQIPIRSGLVRFDRPEFVSAVRGLGVEVHFWVVNDVETAERLLALGASGLVSDDLPALSR
jgi:glycerophosphoryl diester phosphodiesterase